MSTVLVSLPQPCFYSKSSHRSHPQLWGMLSPNRCAPLSSCLISLGFLPANTDSTYVQPPCVTLAQRMASSNRNTTDLFLAKASTSSAWSHATLIDDFTKILVLRNTQVICIEMVCLNGLFPPQFLNVVDRNFPKHLWQLWCEISLYGFCRLLRIVLKVASDDSNNKNNTNNNNNNDMPAKI